MGILVVVCLFVCLYPINVNTSQILFMAPHMALDSRAVYGWSNKKKYQIRFILENLIFVFDNLRRENAADRARIKG